MNNMEAINVLLKAINSGGNLLPLATFAKALAVHLEDEHRLRTEAHCIGVGLTVIPDMKGKRR